MIRLITHIPKLSYDIAAIRILALYQTYGAGYPFLDFWRQTDPEMDTVLICRFYDSVTVWAGENANFEELREFLQSLAPKEIFCSQAVAKKLSLQTVQTCIGLECKRRYMVGGTSLNVSLRAVYDLLAAGIDGPITLPDFESWYPDFSHRLRHGGARFFASDSGIAVSGFETDYAAIITGVAVLPQLRGNGLGKKAVVGLCHELQRQKKRVFTYTTQAVAPFYRKLGFIPVDTYVFGKL